MDASDHASLTTELARERTRAAADRTLLAWIRTALSLIGFGFGLAKSRDVLAEAGVLRRTHSLNSVLVFGASFVALGLICLLGASVQHLVVTRHLDSATFHYKRFRPLAAIVTIALLLIGIYALATIARSHELMQ